MTIYTVGSTLESGYQYSDYVERSKFIEGADPTERNLTNLHKKSGLYTDQEVVVYNQADDSLINGGVNKNVLGMPLAAGSTASITVTKHGDGSATFGSTKAKIFSSNDKTGILHEYDIAGIGPYSFSDGNTSYVIADYNSGSPIMRVTQNVLDINESDIIPLITIDRYGNNLRVQPWTKNANSMVNQIHAMLVKTQRYRRSSGLVISADTARVISITSGIIYYGCKSHSLSSFVSNINNMYLHYHSSGIWSSSITTSANNTQYDNGTNLVSLSVGKYNVNYVYREVGDDSVAHIVLSNTEYSNIADATAGLIPSPLPSIITEGCDLVGIIICRNGDVAPQSVQTAYGTKFTSGGGATSHEDLINILIAGVGVTNGHINDIAQTISGPKSFTDDIDLSVGKYYRINGAILNRTHLDNNNIVSYAGTSKTLDISDNGKYIVTTSSSAVSIIVPPNSSVAFPIGAEIELFQDGTGNITFAQGAGVTVKSAEDNLVSKGRYRGFALKKVSTDIWHLVGGI